MSSECMGGDPANLARLGALDLNSVEQSEQVQLGAQETYSQRLLRNAFFQHAAAQQLFTPASMSIVQGPEGLQTAAYMPVKGLIAAGSVMERESLVTGQAESVTGGA